MKHLKTFERFQYITEEEDIFGKIAASFGRVNTEAILKAEKKLKNPPSGFRPKDTTKRIEEFKTYKAAYEKDPKSEDGLIFSEIVKHLNLNNDAIWVIKVGNDGKKVFKQGMSYGSKEGTAASAGSAS